MRQFVLSSILFFSFPVFSETYVCSHELTKFGQPGEIETLAFERDRGSFKYIYMGVVRDRFQISVETESMIILTDVDSSPPESIDVVFLNKDTKEWGRDFLTLEDIINPGPPNNGKCVIVN
tara:strand:- start:69 stop:431 length:363 start_codon:yes stop_codon:yes gene_type:complete